MPDNMPGIPAIPRDLPLELQRILGPMREILARLSGNAVETADLEALGITAEGGTVAQDSTPPAAPANLKVFGALAMMLLEWEPGQTTGISYTEVWRANENDFSQAVCIGSSPGNLYSDAIGGAKEAYYWVRHISGSTAGSFNAQSGTKGNTGTNAGYILDVLAANPPDSSFNRLLYVQEEDTVIDGIPVPAGTYMNAAYIANGQIVRAMIGNAAIEQANIAQAAVGSAQIQNLAVLDAHIKELTANKIKTGTLSADTKITVGTTVGGLPAIVISGNGEIVSNGTNGDFARMNSGDFEVWKNVPGVGVTKYKALSRVEVGVANNNTTVTIPGYFRDEPKIIVSPFNIQLYKTAYANQDQTLNCQALNIQQTAPGSMKWTFRPVATLTLANNSGSFVRNAQQSPNHDNIEYIDGGSTPANCTRITPNVYLATYRGNGASQYFYRSVRWRVEYWNGSSWVQGGWRQFNLGADTNASVTDAADFIFPGPGQWAFRIAYQAFDTNGSVYGAAVYDYHSDTVTSTGSRLIQTNSLGTFTGNLPMPGYNPPAGYTVYDVDYQVNYRWWRANTNGNITVDGRAVHSAGSGTSGSGSLTRSSGSYSSSELDGRIQVTFRSTLGGSTIALELLSGSALIKSSRLRPNDTTPGNVYRLNSYGFELNTAQVLATGSLNWVALGG